MAASRSNASLRADWWGEWERLLRLKLSTCVGHGFGGAGSGSGSGSVGGAGALFPSEVHGPWLGRGALMGLLFPWAFLAPDFENLDGLYQSDSSPY